MADNQKNQKEIKSSVPARPAAKEKKPFGQRISKWFREIRSELKKITWPTRKEVVQNTVVTLVLVALLGSVIWVADFGLNQLRDYLLSKVDSSEESTSPSDADLDAIVSDAIADALASGSDTVSDADAE